MKPDLLNRLNVFSAIILSAQILVTILFLILGINNLISLLPYVLWLFIITAPFSSIVGLLYLFKGKKGNNGAALISLLLGLSITLFYASFLVSGGFGEK